MGLAGVKVGPLDPDAGESFGQVDASTSARKLIRHHAAMYPAPLLALLNKTVNEPRSRSLDRDEVIEVVAEQLPDGAVVTGANVRGAEDAPKALTYTWEVPQDAGGSGRSGKGAIVYDADTFPDSCAAGDRAAELEKAKKLGVPLEAVVAAFTGRSAPLTEHHISGEQESTVEVEELREENEELRARLDALAERLEAVEVAATTPDAAPDEGAAAADEPPAADASADSPAAEPWEGYDELNADKIRQDLRERNDADEARAVLAYEAANANRSTVIAAANAVLDHTGAPQE